MERNNQVLFHGRVAFVNERASFSSSHCCVIVHEQIFAFQDDSLQSHWLAEQRSRLLALASIGRFAAYKRAAKRHNAKQGHKQEQTLHDISPFHTSIGMSPSAQKSSDIVQWLCRRVPR